MWATQGHSQSTATHVNTQGKQHTMQKESLNLHEAYRPSSAQIYIRKHRISDVTNARYISKVETP